MLLRSCKYSLHYHKMQENLKKNQEKTDFLLCFCARAEKKSNSILDQGFELVVLTKNQRDFGRIAKNGYIKASLNIKKRSC